MSLISDIITDIRVEINDPDRTRFTDDTTMILPLVKQAIRRANRICQRNQMAFAKKSVVVPTVALQDYVAMPVDLDIPIGIWRDDLHQKINQVNEQEWQQIVAAPTLANWFLDLQTGKIMLNAAPGGIIDLTIWYFPKIDATAYTAATTSPWDGRLDDIVARYVALRIQNIEEANVQQDRSILQDMEETIVSVYAPQNPLTIHGTGWL